MSLLRARTRAFAVLAVVPVLLVASLPASADTGQVNVSATNTAKMIMTIGTAAAAFGTGLDPTGAGTSSLVTATPPGTTSGQGVYYVWQPGIGASVVTVKSNKPWVGTIAATENRAGSPSLTVGSGALRFATSAPSTYDQAASGTAFTTLASPWPSSGVKGNSSFTYDYMLRIDWTDDPGTFASVVTYSATP